MKGFQKLRNNLLSPTARSVLGPVLYSAYLASFVANLPKVLSGGKLNSVDKTMGKIAKRFHFRGSTVLFDCQFCDEHLREDSFAFGIVREMYIRNCYFKWHPPSVYENAKKVVDLGANRGAFSTLMTSRAEFILSVECGAQYAPIIAHNMAMNNFASYAVETAVIGSGGATNSRSPRITMRDAFVRHDIETVDLMKMDIEGSEFALFNSADWLNHVKAISMEVHAGYGDPNCILNTLSQHGFWFAMADENLHRISDARQASFLYAWKHV